MRITLIISLDLRLDFARTTNPGLCWSGLNLHQYVTFNLVLVALFDIMLLSDKSSILFHDRLSLMGSWLHLN